VDHQLLQFALDVDWGALPTGLAEVEDESGAGEGKMKKNVFSRTISV
jgi:hypothetical protein